MADKETHLKKRSLVWRSLHGSAPSDKMPNQSSRPLCLNLRNGGSSVRLEEGQRVVPSAFCRVAPISRPPTSGAGPQLQLSEPQVT